MTRLIEKVKRANNNWSVFSNRSRQAYYSFFTQSIHIDSIEKTEIQDLFECLREFKKGINSEKFCLMRRTLSVIHHEYRHWIDSISTVWGTSLIQKVYECNKIRMAGVSYDSPVNEMHKIKDLFDLIRRMHYSSYYTTRFNVENQFPWRTKYSMGKLFARDGRVSNYPIVFTRFSNRDDNLDICRVPFSLSSVLESSAMADEYQMDMMALSLVKDDEHLIEAELYKKEVIENIYNKDIGEYLVAGHHIANFVKTSNVQTAFEICSKLGRIVLNFPTNLFPKLIVNNEALSSISKGTHEEEWLRGIKIAFDYHDRGILFFVISTLLPELKGDEHLSDTYIESSIKVALKKMNIEFAELEYESKIEFFHNMKAIEEQNFAMGNYIVKKGHMLFKELNLFGKSGINLFEFAPIPVILGDDTVYDPYGGASDLNFNICNHVINALNFEPQLIDFCEACIH